MRVTEAGHPRRQLSYRSPHGGRGYNGDATIHIRLTRMFVRGFLPAVNSLRVQKGVCRIEPKRLIYTIGLNSCCSAVASVLHPKTNLAKR